MPKPDAFRYQVKAVRIDPGKAILDSGSRPSITGSPPPDFGGPAETWSPEHLLVSSVALCYWATLEWLLRRRKLVLAGLRCEAEGVVEQTSRGLAFTRVTLQVSATVSAGLSAQVRPLLDQAKSACLVSNSLACPVELSVQLLEEASTVSAPAP